MAAPVAIWAVDSLAESAVGLEELRGHLRVGHTEDDAQIDGFGIAATASVEKFTQRVLVPREAVLRLACLPRGRLPVALPGGHVASDPVVSVSGEPIVGCEVIGSSPARLVPPADWPVVVEDGYPVEISYIAGPSVVPADLVVAIKMITAEMYECRSGGASASDRELPLGAVTLMSRHRILPILR